MDRTERFYKIDQMIHDRKLVPFVDLMAALEVSRATLKRDLEYMRNRLNAPIVWDREGRRLSLRYAARRSRRPVRAARPVVSTRARCMRC
jgi:predicted DNA-binding transcriptional regulator YafY